MELAACSSRPQKHLPPNQKAVEDKRLVRAPFEEEYGTVLLDVMFFSAAKENSQKARVPSPRKSCMTGAMSFWISGLLGGKGQKCSRTLGGVDARTVRLLTTNDIASLREKT